MTGTIVLTSGGVAIDKQLTISGPGADQLTIDGNQTTECTFYAAYTNVTISGLTITNGAAICNDHGTLTVSTCAVTGNSYGVIYVDGSSGPQVEDANDGRNAKKNSGDCAFGFTCLTIANSIISGNSGPGVDNISATVTILNSTISNNSAGDDSGYGGGIYTHGGKLPGNVTVMNSTITDNFAFYGGGGISSGLSGLTIIK